MRGLKERIHENGIDYILCGDYYIPEISIPKQDRPIGHYGRLRKAYLKEYRPVLYQAYLSQDKLYDHLADVNTQATERMERLMEQMLREWGIDEDLKAADQMGWVGIMNNARCSADEIIRRELIYS
ncbi:MAG TPA: TnpV protein [Lachnospiraceae bacterium]|nr:TnpV protein [Lachnospiraceae bacterium]